MKLLAILSAAGLALGACQPPENPNSQVQTFGSTDPSESAARDRPMQIHKNDLAWLVANSPLVFAGTLVDKNAARDERNLIVTRNRFRVDAVFQGGGVGETVTLTTLGGTLGEETLRVSHMPVFEVGERYVVFTDPRRTTYNPVTGNQDGVLRIGPEGGIYTYDGIGITGLRDGLLEARGPRLRGAFRQDPEGIGRVREDPQVVGGRVLRDSLYDEKPVLMLRDFQALLGRVRQQ